MSGKVLGVLLLVQGVLQGVAIILTAALLLILVWGGSAEARTTTGELFSGISIVLLLLGVLFVIFPVLTLSASYSLFSEKAGFRLLAASVVSLLGVVGAAALAIAGQSTILTIFVFCSFFPLGLVTGPLGLRLLLKGRTHEAQPL
ncbi:MAG: hypothetical protein WBD22_04735 [Pyrinomonadaceae bacterium]